MTNALSLLVCLGKQEGEKGRKMADNCNCFYLTIFSRPFLVSDFWLLQLTTLLTGNFSNPNSLLWKETLLGTIICCKFCCRHSVMKQVLCSFCLLTCRPMELAIINQTSTYCICVLCSIPGEGKNIVIVYKPQILFISTTSKMALGGTIPFSLRNSKTYNCGCHNFPPPFLLWAN